MAEKSLHITNIKMKNKKSLKRLKNTNKDK